MKFSVLMAIYNKENFDYFNTALISIWEEQTLKPDEIVIVEDGGLTNELYNVISNWKKKLDNKLVVVKLENNVGFAKALNVGLEFCKYEIVARMDTDDISLPNRFEEQIKYMRINKEITACGSFIQEFDGDIIKQINLPVNQEDIKKFIKLRSPICHPSSVFRKKDVITVGGYPELRLGQDYALWSILVARGYKITNIPKVLLKLRVNNDFFKRRGWDSFKYEVAVIKLQNREKLINDLDSLKAFILRLILRLSPVVIKKFAYKLLRK